MDLAAVSRDKYHSVPKAGALCIRLCPRLNHIRKATVMLKVALRRSSEGAVLAVCTYKAAVGGMLLTTSNCHAAHAGRTISPSVAPDSGANSFAHA